METEIQFLSQIIDKQNTLALQVGMIGEVEDTLALLDARMTELQQATFTVRGWIRQGLAEPPADATFLQRCVWWLIDLNQSGDIAFDRKCAAIIWPPAEYPQYDGHTVSFILGQEELAGNAKAKAFCDLLALFMGANHCVNAQNLKP